MNRKKVTLAIVVILVVGIIIYLESMKSNPGKGDNTELVVEGDFILAPELDGISGYLNTDDKEIRISDFKGKVVLIDFWTYTCINCIRTLPFLTEWDEKYRDSGLVIIGVHTPEFEFEKDKSNVQDAIDKYGIEYAVVQDNDFLTWRAFNNRYWPRKYLIDSKGLIRYDHIGEGAYEETERVIQELLAEIGSDVGSTELTLEEKSGGKATTPELYAGYSFALGRGQNVGNEGGLQPDQTIEYLFPEAVVPSVIYLNGLWKSNSDNLELVGSSGSILLLFQGGEVNIVADSFDEGTEMEVLINGNYLLPNQAGSDIGFEGERAFVDITNPQLYNIVDGEHGLYLLELRVEEGFKFNAFTFG